MDILFISVIHYDLSKRTSCWNTSPILPAHVLPGFVLIAICEPSDGICKSLVFLSYSNSLFRSSS